MIAPNSIQEVRDRADILDIVGHFLSLKRRGSNYVANCPFHNEKTPSFNVNPARGIFKCFGCGKAGDALTFVQEHEKFSFVEAVKWLANYYNIELEETNTTNEQKEQQHTAESLRILNEFATKLFETQLWEHKEGKQIGLSYFKERGFSDATIQKFRLGYALDSWNAFYDEAIRNGYSEDMLIKSGLVAHKNDKTYDNYRGRVIFPIFSNTGKILGFGARILKNNVKAPKYVNTPENEIYNKSYLLYGLYQSRTAISKADECFLVEGYTDVISLHQSEIENVVASSGTSLTEGQLKLIKNLSKNLTILYDGDAAGIKAAIRGMEMALSNSFNVQIVLLPDGEDPDSYIQKNGSNALLDYIQKNKKNVIDFTIQIQQDEVKNDAVKKSALVNDIAHTISLINKAEDFVIQQEYIKSAASQLAIEEQGLINLVNKKIRESLKKESFKKPDEPIEIQENETDLPPLTDGNQQQDGLNEEWKMLEILLKYGDKPFNEIETISNFIYNTYDINSFQNETVRHILTAYENYQSDGLPHEQIVQKFIQNDNANVQAKSIDLLVSSVSPNPKWVTQLGIKHGFNDDIYIQEAQSTFAYYELSVLQQMIKENLESIKNIDQNPQELLTLMNVHKQLKERERSLMNIVVKK